MLKKYHSQNRKRSQTAYKIVKIQLDHPVLIKVYTIHNSQQCLQDYSDARGVINLAIHGSRLSTRRRAAASETEVEVIAASFRSSQMSCAFPEVIER